MIVQGGSGMVQRDHLSALPRVGVSMILLECDTGSQEPLDCYRTHGQDERGVDLLYLPL